MACPAVAFPAPSPDSILSRKNAAPGEKVPVRRFLLYWFHHRHTAVDGNPLLVEFGLIVGHHTAGAIGVEVPGDLVEGESRLGKLLQRELKQGVVVRLEVDLAVLRQHLAVEGQEIPMGQAALGLPLGGPGVAEVDEDPVHLSRGEELRQAGCVPHQEEHVAKLRLHGPLHGHHLGVGHLLHGDEQHLRVLPGSLHGEAALSAAQLQIEGLGPGHQLPPAPPHGGAVLHVDSAAALHPRNQIFLLTHPHGRPSVPKVCAFILYHRGKKM